MGKISPENLLLVTVNFCMLESFERVDGSVPVKKLSSSPSASKLVNSPITGLIVDVNLFELSHRLSKTWLDP